MDKDAFCSSSEEERKKIFSNHVRGFERSKGSPANGELLGDLAALDPDNALSYIKEYVNERREFYNSLSIEDRLMFISGPKRYNPYADVYVPKWAIDDFNKRYHDNKEKSEYYTDNSTCDVILRGVFSAHPERLNQQNFDLVSEVFDGVLPDIESPSDIMEELTFAHPDLAANNPALSSFLNRSGIKPSPETKVERQHQRQQHLNNIKHDRFKGEFSATAYGITGGFSKSPRKNGLDI